MIVIILRVKDGLKVSLTSIYRYNCKYFKILTKGIMY